MTSINIRPGVNVLTVLRHLNYKPWFALAEFVDNALQSFLLNRGEIAGYKSGPPKLRVELVIDPYERRMVIRDNAGGIRQADFPRAFRAAELPPDRTGLSEFGMGMKSAACWFAPRWSARTSALGESIERTIRFDIGSIVRDSLEELAVEERQVDARDHFTEIVLSDVYKVPAGRTLGKIREHLSDIYRIYLRQQTLDLTLNGEALSYSPPEIMHEPYYKIPEGDKIQWMKQVVIDLPEDRQVYGFAAIRQTASTSHAGFALFRRNRLIQGSADEGYRPEAIFGRSNSFAYQRLFGELHLKGFGVSHTKDGIQWDGLEEVFLERLRQVLDAEPLPLLKQAREFRFTPRREELQRAADVAIDRTAAVMAREMPTVIDTFRSPEAVDESEGGFTENTAPPLARREILVEHGQAQWRITLETSNDPAVGDWFEVLPPADSVTGPRRLGIRLSLAHPFTQRFSSAEPREIELLLRISAALAVAEALARGSGVRQAGAIRTIFNELLRSAFSS